MFVIANANGFAGLKDDLARLRRTYETKRLNQVKRFHESLKKIAVEERDTWFPKKKKEDPVVEVVED